MDIGWSTVLTALLSLLGVLAGGKYLVRARQVLKAVKEGSDLFGVIDRVGDLIDKAHADNRVTPEEWAAIGKEVGRFKPEFDEFKLALKKITAPIK